MYCKRCGHKLEDEALFCGKCGLKIDATYDSVPKTRNKSKVAAGLMGLILGSLGIHNFYLGYTTKAIIQLCLTILSGGTLSTISFVWGFVEGILILTGVIKSDASGLPLDK